jgi:hypothetical protein
VIFAMERFAYLLERFAATPDPLGGTLLDNAVVFCSSDCSEGWSHSVFDQLDFVNGIDVDCVDAGTHCLVQFFIRLARPVENNLVGTKARAQGLKEFTAAIHFDVDARVAHRAEHGHVGVCF